MRLNLKNYFYLYGRREKTTMTTIQITHGLTTPKPTPIDISPYDIEEYAKQHNDLYEFLYQNDKKVRAFIDIDGCLPLDTTEEDFNTTNQMVLNILSNFEWNSPVSITTSSKYNSDVWKSDVKKHKLSYGIVFLKRYGSRHAIREWTQNVIAPQLKEALSFVIPFYIKGVDKDIPNEGCLDYDNSVYDRNRRMRCVYTSKPNEDRPRIIYSQHSVLDTMITYVPNDCEALPEPEINIPQNIITIPQVEEFQSDDVLFRMVMGLNKKRADDRKDWLSVGIILFNEDSDVSIWEKFSQQSDKYKYGECQRLWRGFHKGQLTQRTLWKMLKEDNLTLYNELNAERKDLRDLVSGGVTHYPCAKHFFESFPDDYMYDVSSGWWFIQSNNTWVNSGKKIPPTLCVKISRTLFNDIEDFRSSIRQSVSNTLDENSIECLLMKKAIDLSKSLLQARFCESIASFCQGLYAEKTISRLEKTEKKNVKELMDSNPMLFAFKDSLHDFQIVDGKSVGKRSIEPTDYITITTGYNYPTPNPQIRQHLESVLKTIWSKQGKYGDDGETYEYVMKIISSTLCGVRWIEAFFILTGSGRNGKGLLFELLQEVFGNYYYQLPVQVLTTKIDNPRSPNPDIANLVGKRIVCSSEPEANEKLHEGTIKYMTGGDKLTGRALYGDPISFKPQHGQFLQCNNIPLFNGITRGGVMRNRVIPFPFEFKSDPKTEREKKSDPHIKDVLCKSPEWRDEMFLLLLEYFETIRGKGIDNIKMPKLVEERTNEYVNDNNLIGSWWEENYIQAEGEYVLSREAYNDFKVETGSLMSDKQFKAGLEFNLLEVKMIGKRGVMKGKMGIANWRRKTDDEKRVVEPGSDDEKE